MQFVGIAYCLLQDAGIKCFRGSDSGLALGSPVVPRVSAMGRLTPAMVRPVGPTGSIWPLRRNLYQHPCLRGGEEW